jgi:hypothetical protein
MNMTEWIYDRSGYPQIILDGDRFLDRGGINTIGWKDGTGAFTPTGHPAGWFEDGVLSDIENLCVGFTADATGKIPARPAEVRARPMPNLAESPERPEFRPTPSRPESGDFSTIPLDYVFDDKRTQMYV